MIRGLNARLDGVAVHQMVPQQSSNQPSTYGSGIYYRPEQNGNRQQQYAYYQHGVGGGHFNSEPRALSEPPLPPPPPELLHGFGDSTPIAAQAPRQNGNQGDMRSALLSEILNGVRLRRTATNDRSVPRI